MSNTTQTFEYQYRVKTLRYTEWSQWCNCDQDLYTKYGKESLANKPAGWNVEVRKLVVVPNDPDITNGWTSAD